LAEPFLGIDDDKLKYLIPLGEDVHERVRFQLLCTLGEEDTPLARETRKRMLFEDLADPWIQIAALSARNPDYNGLLNTAVSNFEAWGSDAASLVIRLADMLAAGGNIEEVKRLIGQSMAVGRGSEEGVWQAAVLQGLGQRNRDERFRSAEMEYER